MSAQPVVRLTLVASLSVMLGIGASPRVDARSPQTLVGLQAQWADLGTWSNLLEASRENELGLGLHATGPSGTAKVAFLGKLAVMSPTVPPSEIRVQIAASEFANPMMLRQSTLTFAADASTDRRFTIDLGAVLRTDDPAPGGIPQNGVATMRASDFVRLAQAGTLSANILGFDVIMRDDQIRAMKDFAIRLHLIKPEAP